MEAAAWITPSHVDVIFEPGLEKTIQLKAINDGYKEFEALVFSFSLFLYFRGITERAIEQGFFHGDRWKILINKNMPEKSEDFSESLEDFWWIFLRFLMGFWNHCKVTNAMILHLVNLFLLACVILALQ